jgi:hypothetical protein
MIHANQLMTAPNGRLALRLLNIVALTMWLQLRWIGRRTWDVFDERAYFVSSLVARSAVDRPVFAGTMAG